MAKRQIPIGDPRIRGMNDTQWVFELAAMNKEDEERYKDIQMMAEVTREQMVSMLGLNLCPVEDEKTGLLRMPRPHEVMPLAIMTGRDDVLQMIKERHEELVTQEQVQADLEGGAALGDGAVELTPEELEEFMNDPGDVEFDNTPEELVAAMGWGNRTTQTLLENLVLNKDDLRDGEIEGGARTIGEARADMRREHAQKADDVDLIPVEILSDRAVEKEPAAARSRPVITLDSD